MIVRMLLNSQPLMFSCIRGKKELKVSWIILIFASTIRKNLKINQKTELDSNLYYNNAIFLYTQVLNHVTKKRRYLYLSLQREIIWFFYAVLVEKVPKFSFRFYKNVSQWRFNDLSLHDVELKNNISIDTLYKEQIDKLINLSYLNLKLQRPFCSN